MDYLGKNDCKEKQATASLTAKKHGVKKDS